MSNETRNIIIIAIIVFIGIVSVFAIVDTNDPKKEVEDNVDNKQMMKLKEFEDGFMEGCVVDPSMKDYCECTYDEITKNYTDEEIIDFYLKYKDGDPVEVFREDKIRKIYSKCSDNL